MGGRGQWSKVGRIALTAAWMPHHPRCIDPGRSPCIGPVATEDPLISVGERLMFEEQMREAGVDWRMNLYGGAQHSFTHPEVDRIGVPGLRFDQISAERSWRAMLDLFDETFR